MNVETGVRSNTTKKVFITVVIIVALCVYKFIYLDYIGGDDVKRRIYKDYVMTEARIVDTHTTGRRGTLGRSTMWYLEYQNSNGRIYRNRQFSEGLKTRKVGEFIYIYYNPNNPNEYVTEKEYNKVNN